MDISNKELQPQSELNRTDKLRHCSIQRVISGLLILFGLIDAVVLFLINNYASSYIVLSLSITCLFVIILGILSLWWSLQETKYLSSTDDEWGEATDNFLGRGVQFLAIVVGVTFTVLNFIYSFAQQQIINNYAASVSHPKPEEFSLYLSVRYHWIVFLAVIIGLNIFGTIYNTYGLAISQNTARFQIYIFSVLLCLTSYVVLDRIFYLYQLLAGAAFSAPLLTSWAYNILLGLSLLIIVLTIAIIFINVRRYRVAFLLLGSILLVVLPIYTTAAGQVARDYTTSDVYFKSNCRSALQNIPKSYVEKHACLNKYLFGQVNQGCPDPKSQVCNWYLTNCPKTDIVQVWEVDINDDPTQHPQGCLDSNCCGKLSGLYTDPILQLVAFTLASAFLVFTLIVFSYYLSQKVKGERTLGKGLELGLIVMFVLVLVAGGLFVALYNHDELPTKPETVLVKMKIEKSTQYAQFPPINKKGVLCKSLNDLIDNGAPLVLNDQCDPTDTNCPINKPQNPNQNNYPKGVLFGVWANLGKGNEVYFERPETTNTLKIDNLRFFTQQPQFANFFWPDYNGNGKDYFVVQGAVSNVQDFFTNQVKVCYDQKAPSLEIKLSQKVVYLVPNKAAVELEGQKPNNVHNEVHDDIEQIIKNHKNKKKHLAGAAGTEATNTGTNGTATNSTAANHSAANSTAANSTAANSTAANSTATNSTAANSTAANSTAANSTAANSTAANATVKCQAPNCNTCKNGSVIQCEKCLSGFNLNATAFTCTFSGDLSNKPSVAISLPLAKPIVSNITGYALGILSTTKGKQFQPIPLQEAKVCWLKHPHEECAEATPEAGSEGGSEENNGEGSSSATQGGQSASGASGASGTQGGTHEIQNLRHNAGDTNNQGTSQATGSQTNKANGTTGAANSANSTNSSNSANSSAGGVASLKLNTGSTDETGSFLVHIQTHQNAQGELVQGKANLANKANSNSQIGWLKITKGGFQPLVIQLVVNGVKNIYLGNVYLYGNSPIDLDEVQTAATEHQNRRVLSTCTVNEDCTTCDALGRICTQCPESQLPDGSGKCKKVTAGCQLSNCLVCEVNSGTQVCNLCQGGYYLGTNNQCVKSSVCEVDILMCQTCGPALFNQSQCSVCQTGTYLDQSKQCQKTLCDPSVSLNCRFCNPDQPKQCTSCLDGYSIQENIQEGTWTCSTGNRCNKRYESGVNNCLQCEAQNSAQCTPDGCDAFSKFIDPQIAGGNAPSDAPFYCKLYAALCGANTPEHCTLCSSSDSTKCAVCNIGYSLSSGTCKANTAEQNQRSISTQLVFGDVTVQVGDAMSHQNLHNVEVELYQEPNQLCGEPQQPLYQKGVTNSNGQVEFLNVQLNQVYSVILRKKGYKLNCKNFLPIYYTQLVTTNLSGDLEQGKQRIVLEWNSESADLDLFLSFNPSPKYNCMVGFVSESCGGATFGSDSTVGTVQYEAIEVNQLTQSNYLVFVQSTNGISQERAKTQQNGVNDDFLTSQAQIKYYVHNRDGPAMIFNLPVDQLNPAMDFDVARHTNALAWLAFCLDGTHSEVPQQIINTNGVWWTTNMNRWNAKYPKKLSNENYPQPTVCDVAIKQGNKQVNQVASP